MSCLHLFHFMVTVNQIILSPVDFSSMATLVITLIEAPGYCLILEMSLCCIQTLGFFFSIVLKSQTRHFSNSPGFSLFPVVCFDFFLL